jgi:hypothetical protein
MHFEPAARLPPKQKGPVQSMLQEVRETRVREGPLEVVTLQVVTSTPWLALIARSTDRVPNWLVCAGSGTSSPMCLESC